MPTLLEQTKTQAARLRAIGLLAILATLLLALPYLVAWIIGLVVRAFFWIIAAAVAGYKAGRGKQ